MMGAQAVRLTNVDIDNALKNRHFEIVFQPVFGLKDGAPVRVEAYVRWRHPGLGVLPPGAFISFFETQGRMGELTRYVLDHALTDYAAWRGARKDAPGLSVNLAHSDLFDDTFPPHLEVMLRERAVAPGAVTLECPIPSENIDVATLQESLASLKDVGVRLAVEVRGRAGDALRAFQPFPFDEIKTGGAAILRFARTVRGPGMSAISEILDIARNANADTTAVGVEDAESLAALQSLGFSSAQGNILTRTGAISEFTVDALAAVSARIAPDGPKESEIQEVEPAAPTRPKRPARVAKKPRVGVPKPEEATVTLLKETGPGEQGPGEPVPREQGPGEQGPAEQAADEARTAPTAKAPSKTPEKPPEKSSETAPKTLIKKPDSANPESADLRASVIERIVARRAAQEAERAASESAAEKAKADAPPTPEPAKPAAEEAASAKQDLKELIKARLAAKVLEEGKKPTPEGAQAPEGPTPEAPPPESPESLDASLDERPDADAPDIAAKAPESAPAKPDIPLARDEETARSDADKYAKQLQLRLSAAYSYTARKPARRVTPPAQSERPPQKAPASAEPPPQAPSPARPSATPPAARAPVKTPEPAAPIPSSTQSPIPAATARAAAPERADMQKQVAPRARRTRRKNTPFLRRRFRVTHFWPRSWKRWWESRQADRDDDIDSDAA